MQLTFAGATAEDFAGASASASAGVGPPWSTSVSSHFFVHTHFSILRGECLQPCPRFRHLASTSHTTCPHFTLSTHLRQLAACPERRRRRLAHQLHAEVAHPLRPVLLGDTLAALPRSPQAAGVDHQLAAGGGCKEELKWRFRREGALVPAHDRLGPHVPLRSCLYPTPLTQAPLQPFDDTLTHIASSTHRCPSSQLRCPVFQLSCPVALALPPLFLPL